MKFRYIEFENFDAYTNMALDETIMENVRNEKCLPTIRIYGWNPGAISIGYFQGLHNEVVIDECEKEKVDIVRRQTGGGAVFHDTKGEITYSIIAPENLFSKNIIKSYEEICSIIISALKKIGINASFNPINDIITNGKKISGNAQTRKGGILLQHGTILYSVDVDKMFSLLKVGKEKIADKLIQSVKKRVTSISDENQAAKEDLLKALEDSFREKFELEIDKYTNEELEKAKDLAKEKYSSKDWNEMR